MALLTVIEPLNLESTKRRLKHLFYRFSASLNSAKPSSALVCSFVITFSLSVLYSTAEELVGYVKIY
jgi:hypothetical protein